MKAIFAELNNSVDTENVSTIVMFPIGNHTITPKTSGGEPKEINVTIDETAYTNLKASFESNKEKELTIDYNHQGLGGEIAGWVKGIEFDINKGIIGIIKWSKVTAEKIREGVIRYFSPAFIIDETTGLIRAFEVPVMGGLTNNPAFTELKNNPIRAEKQGDNHMAETIVEVKAEEVKAEEKETKVEEKKEEVKASMDAPPVSTPTHEKQESPAEEKKEHETGKEVGEGSDLYEATKAFIAEAMNKYKAEAEAQYATRFEAVKAETEEKMKKFEAELPSVIEKYVKCMKTEPVRAEKSQDGPTRVERKLRTEVLGKVIRAQADELTGKGGNGVTYLSDTEIVSKRNLMIETLKNTGMDFQKAWRTVQTTNPELF